MFDHSHYIKSMADKSGKTYRELESLWKKSQRDFEFDQMMNPNKYQSLKKMDGSTAEEIGRRFEKMVAGNEEQPNEVVDINAIEPTIPVEPVIELNPELGNPQPVIPEIPVEQPLLPTNPDEEVKTPEEIQAELAVGGNEISEFTNI